MTDIEKLRAECDRLRQEMEVRPSWETARLLKQAVADLLQADAESMQKITGFDVKKLHETVPK